MRVCPLVDSSEEIWRASLNPPRTFLRTETLPRRRQLRCSDLDGHRRRRRPRIAFGVRRTCFRCAAALSACTLDLPASRDSRLENHPFRRTRASDVGATLLVFVLGFQSWRVDSEGGKSKHRSIEVKVRGPTLPATRSNHQVGCADNRV